MPADGEDVRTNDGHDEQFARRPRESDEPRERVDAGGQERDVLARDREQVVEAGCPEVAPRGDREVLVLAEHDPEHDAAADAARAATDRALDALAEAVAQAEDPAPVTHETPVVRSEHDVDPLPSEPGALVEAVLRWAGLDDAHPRFQEGAARRRATDGELQENALVELASAERSRLREHADGERRAPCGRDSDQLGLSRPVEVGDEEAVLERVHTERAPAQA